MKQLADKRMLKAGRGALHAMTCIAVLFGQLSAAEPHVARRPLHANQPTLVLGTSSQPRQQSSRRRWSDDSGPRRMSGPPPRAGLSIAVERQLRHASPLARGFKNYAAKPQPAPPEKRIVSDRGEQANGRVQPRTVSTVAPQTGPPPSFETVDPVNQLRGADSSTPLESPREVVLDTAITRNPVREQPSLTVDTEQLRTETPFLVEPTPAEDAQEAADTTPLPSSTTTTTTSSTANEVEHPRSPGSALVTENPSTLAAEESVPDSPDPEWPTPKWSETDWQDTDWPSANWPRAGTPTASTPTADEPTADEPTADEPTGDGLTGDGPAVDGPATEGASTESQQLVGLPGSEPASEPASDAAANNAPKDREEEPADQLPVEPALADAPPLAERPGTEQSTGQTSVEGSNDAAQEAQQTDPRSDSKELAEARVLLRLIDTLGVKTGIGSHQQIAASLPREPRPWSTADSPVQPISNGDLYERDSAWQSPESDWEASTEPTGLDRLAVENESDSPALSEETTEEPRDTSTAVPPETAAPEFAQNSLREVDRQFDHDEPIEEPEASHLAGKTENENPPVERVIPPALLTLSKPVDLSEEKSAGGTATAHDTGMSQAAGQSRAEPAPSIPAPSALADIKSDNGVTFRVSDGFDAQVDSFPVSAPESLADVATSEPASRPAWPDGLDKSNPEQSAPRELAGTEASTPAKSSRESDTAEDFQSAPGELARSVEPPPVESGHRVRDRLKSAIEKSVGEVGSKKPQLSEAGPQSQLRKSPTPQLAGSTGAPPSVRPARTVPSPSEALPATPNQPQLVVPVPTSDSPASRTLSSIEVGRGAGDRAMSQPRLFTNQPPSPVAPQVGAHTRSAARTIDSAQPRRPTEVRLAARTSYPLQAPGRVARVTVVDRSVCDVVQHSPFELALIGKREGQTDVAVWLEGQPSAQVYRIVVGRGGAFTENEGKLQQLLSELFPASSVRITQRNGTVKVDGQAKDRQEAIQILSVVRSVKLVPVVDNLQLMRR